MERGLQEPLQGSEGHLSENDVQCPDRDLPLLLHGHLEIVPWALAFHGASTADRGGVLDASKHLKNLVADLLPLLESEDLEFDVGLDSADEFFDSTEFEMAYSIRVRRLVEELHGLDGEAQTPDWDPGSIANAEFIQAQGQDGQVAMEPAGAGAALTSSTETLDSDATCPHARVLRSRTLSSNRTSTSSATTLDLDLHSYSVHRWRHGQPRDGIAPPLRLSPTPVPSSTMAIATSSV